VNADSRTNGRRGPPEITGLDFASSALKAVKIKKSREGLVIVGTAILGWRGAKNDPLPASRDHHNSALPRQLRSAYAALAVSGTNAIVSLIRRPLSAAREDAFEASIRGQMGLEGNYRVSYVPSGSARGRSESEYLAVALPEADAQGVLACVSSGTPAPVSLEVSGLAALGAFMHAAGKRHIDDCVGIVEAGAETVFLVVLNKGAPVLARTFPSGGDTITRILQKKLGVNAEISMDIISDGAFDTSQTIREVMAPFFQQLSLSKDYVERRENCRVSAIYLSGGLTLSRCWREEIARVAATDVETWNPFDGLKMAPGASLPEAEGHESRFAAAVGVGLNALELK